MEVIKFSDFMGKNYDSDSCAEVETEKSSLNEKLVTILVAMLIVYVSPLVLETIMEVFRKVVLVP